MTFLRWAGSKRQLIPILSSFWYAASRRDGGSRYVEGFCGSAALFFSVRPKQGLLIDCNAALVECIEQVKMSPRRVSLALSGFAPDEDTYYRVRAFDTDHLEPALRAARFIYLNRLCFNGLYRTNAAGHFNVPFGGWKSGRLPSVQNLSEASLTLRTTTVVCGDFQSAVMKNLRKGDFVYLDPPYAVRNKSLDFQYGPDVFGSGDIERLAVLASEIDSIGATFVISYADCPEIAALVNRWGCERVQVRRTVAATASRRQPATEVLISNL
ncbi:MAG: Dam family site-specific DNA-(adenine-N6)-methyltransferase [Casimicrobium sp.]